MCVLFQIEPVQLPIFMGHYKLDGSQGYTGMIQMELTVNRTGLILWVTKSDGS